LPKTACRKLTRTRLQSRENIEVRIIAVYNQEGGVQHGKFFVVDREVVFLGSQNFDWRALDHIHEIGVKIEHPEYARKMTELFEFDWRQSETNQLIRATAADTIEWLTLKETDGQVVKFFATASPIGNIPPGFSADLPAIVELIDNAKSRVYVQLLSYSPSIRDGHFPDLESALQRAAERGVTVRLLCSDWCQHKYEMPYLKELVQKDNLDVKLSTIPEWSEDYISYSRVEHCKFMVVDDDFSWIGTSNWKRDYFYESRNQAVVVNNFAVNQALTAIFLKSWEGPYAWQIDPKKEYQPKDYGEKD
jgi:phosphatidylserine/phosphatidylglycerophosphate/cardiolipin synthase-like enzyme